MATPGVDRGAQLGQVRGMLSSDYDDVQPDDSASQVGSRIRMTTISEAGCSSRSSALADIKLKAAVKKAALAARQSALQQLQDLEIEELKCRQRREKIELGMKLAEIEAEENLCEEFSSSVGSHAGSRRTSGRSSTSSKQNHSDVKLNPDAPEWKQDDIGHDVINRPSPLTTVDQQKQLIEALQLPKLEVMMFDGNPLKYWPFIRSFENSVEKFSIGSDAKLTRLLQYCTGKAEQVIQCCTVMDPEVGYARAKQLLRQRFGNDYVICETWIKRVTDFGVLRSNDKEGLRDFSDLLNTCKETLTAMGCVSEINNQTNLLRIVEKLPIHLQNSWRKQARDIRVDQGLTPTIENLTMFVQRAAETANDPVYGIPSSSARREDVSGVKRITKGSESGASGHLNFHVQSSTASSTANGRKCTMCSGDHILFRCDEFKKMTPEERLKFTRARRLCDNCLMVGHRAAQCSKPATCSVAGCGKKHTKFLHQINSTSSGADALSQHTNQQQQPNPEGEITGAHCGLAGAGSKARVALPVVPVRVRAKGSTQFVDTCALLDSGSTNTFCSEELCKLLGVEGRSETFSLTTLDKANSVEETKVVSLKISSLDSKVTINLPRVYTRKILPISLQNVATGDDVKAWPHLHDIELPNIDGLNIMLLIGQDIPEAIIIVFYSYMKCTTSRQQLNMKNRN